MPVFSRSEWGAFRYDESKDMKVLRKRARGALMWWNNGKPRTDMQMRFGYAFSIIHNGKLVDSDLEYTLPIGARAVIVISFASVDGENSLPTYFINCDDTINTNTAPIITING